MSRKEIVDGFLGKFVSRKLTVFIVASVGLFMSNITSHDWVVISTVYIGSQAVVDIVYRLMKNYDNGI